ncbi:MAG: hypothetical protein J5916_10545 [Oscillospiraceae bacterium]|nr:hypothetical protein [Oscillospiraceae bacterium]
MAIVKQYHKDTGITYVYESVSYWDEEKKQSRSKRRLIGKLNPETGEIIPTGKRGPRPKAGQEEAPDRDEEYRKEIKELTLIVDKKDLEIDALRKENGKLRTLLEQLDKRLNELQTLIHSGAAE